MYDESRELLPTEVSPTRMYLKRQLNYRLSYISAIFIIISGNLIQSCRTHKAKNQIMLIKIQTKMLARMIFRLSFPTSDLPPQKPPLQPQTQGLSRSYQKVSKGYRIKLKHIADPNYFTQIINNQHSLQQTNRLLNAIASGGSGLSISNFQTVFKKYCYYVEKLPEKSGYAQAGVHEKVVFLDALSQVYAKMGNLMTSQMLKTFNKVSSELFPILSRSLSQPTELIIQQLSLTLVSISRYNNKKCYALFKSIQNRFHNTKCLLKITKKSALYFLQLFKNLRTSDRLIVETCIDVLKDQVKTMNLEEFQLVVYALGENRVPVIKSFVLTLLTRLKKQLLRKIDPNTGQSYPKSKHNLRQELKILESISLIEVNMNLASAYLPELNQLYQLELLQFSKYLDKMDDRQIGMFCGLLRRSGHYDQVLLQSLASQMLTRPIKQLKRLDFQQLQQNSKLPKRTQKQLSINTIASGLHTLAFYNYRDQPLIAYFIKSLQLIAGKQKLQSNQPIKDEVSLNKTSRQLILINEKNRGSSQKGHILLPKHYSRVIWALCVLGTQQELAKIYPIIWPYFNNQYSEGRSPPMHESLNFYYSYLLLKTYFPSHSLNFPQLAQHLSPKMMLSQISQTHQKIYQAFLSSGVAALKQYNVSNLMCDIFIPRYVTNSNKAGIGRENQAKTKNQRYVVNNVVIDVHGQHHFMRNCDKIKGGTWLKGKILQNQGYIYQYIGVQEWGLIQEKQLFVKDFMNRIAINYGVVYRQGQNEGRIVDQSQQKLKNSKTLVERKNKGESEDGESMSRIRTVPKMGRRIKTNSLKLDNQLNVKKSQSQ